MNPAHLAAAARQTLPPAAAEAWTALLRPAWRLRRSDAGGFEAAGFTMQCY